MQRVLLKDYAKASGIKINTLRRMLPKALWAQKIGKCWYINVEMADTVFKGRTQVVVPKASLSWFKTAKAKALAEV